MKNTPQISHEKDDMCYNKSSFQNDTTLVWPNPVVPAGLKSAK
jgi:hypothetical protein